MIAEIAALLLGLIFVVHCFIRRNKAMFSRWFSRPKDVFIVHTGTQKRTEVSSMKTQFSERDLDTFVDMDMKHGNPQTEMEDSLELSRHIVVVLSREFLKKPHPLAELQYAHKRMKWLRSKTSSRWESLWVVLYDLSVDDLKLCLRNKKLSLPPLDNDLVLIEYANGMGAYPTWDRLVDEVAERILKQDGDGALEQWYRFLEDWDGWCFRGYPRASNLYKGNR